MKPITRRIIALLIVMSLFTVAFSGCSFGGKKLTFYVVKSVKEWNEYDPWLRTIKAFDEANKGISIKIVEFDTPEELEAKLEKELAAGGGPDLIFSSIHNSVVDIESIKNSGNLLLLDDYFKNDDTFNENNYITPVLNSGAVNNERYIVPVAFFLPGILTSEEKLTVAGIDMSGMPFTMKELLTLISQEVDRLSNDDGRYAYFTLNSSVSEMTLLLTSGLLNIDYNQKTVSLDKELFKEYLELRANIKTGDEKAYNIISNTRNSEGLGEGTFYSVFFDPVTNLINNALSIRGNLIEIPVFQGLPVYNESTSYYASVALQAAINKNTKLPDEAYKFIRYVMDNNIIQGASNPTALYYFSVNKTAINEYLDSVIEIRGKTRSELSIKYYNEIRPLYENIISNITGCVSLSNELYTLIYNNISGYYDGEISFDDCYNNIINEAPALLG